MILLLRADARRIPLADNSVDCVVTSPPYWGLREYDIPPRLWGEDLDCSHEWAEAGEAEGYASKARWQHSSNGRGEEQPAEKCLRDPVSRSVRPEAWTQVAQGRFCMRCGGWLGSLGLEPTVQLYLDHLLCVLGEVRRVLKPSGLLWLNMGDCYHSGDRGGYRLDAHRWEKSELQSKRAARGGSGIPLAPNRLPQPGLKDKDLVGMPWRVALALQERGWWLRSDIVWSKRNPMPESVRDRPTRSHEYTFMLAKSGRYYFDADAVREPHTYGQDGDHHRNVDGRGQYQAPGQPPHNGLHALRGFDTRRAVPGQPERRSKTAGPGPHTGGRRQAPEPGEPGAFHPKGRNIRSVWHFSTQPYCGAHFATFPEELVRRCVLAGCPPGGIVLDPFCGSGTVGKVAVENGRLAVLCDLGYHELAKARVAELQRPLLACETGS